VRGEPCFARAERFGRPNLERKHVFIRISGKSLDQPIAQGVGVVGRVAHSQIDVSRRPRPLSKTKLEGHTALEHEAAGLGVVESDDHSLKRHDAPQSIERNLPRRGFCTKAILEGLPELRRRLVRH
jgi:hypothetical protein